MRHVLSFLLVTTVVAGTAHAPAAARQAPRKADPRRCSRRNL